MEVQIINGILALITVLLANYGTKLGRIYPIIKDVLQLVNTKIASKKDGKLTIKEKAALYDDMVLVLQDGYDIVKGLTPLKHKNKLI